VYGLPEAELRWHVLLSKGLVKHGFKPCTTDSCLSNKTRRGNTTTVLVYVDGMLVAGTLADVQDVKTLLAQSFTVTDRGVA
jgi:hypothetical protein